MSCFRDQRKEEKTYRFRKTTRSDTTQLLHVSTGTNQQTQVHAQGTDISTSLAIEPDDTEVALIVELQHLALVDGSHTESLLHSRDQRRTLEEGTRESLHSLAELLLTGVGMKTDHGNVLLTSALLGFYQSSSAVNANNQISCNLRIEGSTVARLFHLQDTSVECPFRFTENTQKLKEIKEKGVLT